MLVEVKVPVLAESIADATLLAWRKRPGEPVRRGEHLIDLETDKVTLEVTAPEDGVLKEVLRQEGERARSQEPLAVIDTEAAPEAPSAVPQAPSVTPKTGPAARHLAGEHALDTAALAAHTAGERVTKADVLSYLQAHPSPRSAAADAVPNASAARSERRVPMSRLRQRTAERLLAAQHQSAILSTFNEVNLQPVLDLRERYAALFEQEHGVRLGLMPFFCKAVVLALRRFPIVNASIEEGHIVYHDYYDLGIAIAAPRGLLVPVIRDCDRLSFAEIEVRIRALSEQAREAKLSIEDLSGGTFTITNGGVFGSLLSTPILNPPQSAILGMHRIQQRPVAENGAVVVRPMMYLALSYDHRIIDGREAVQMLVTVKQQLEDPARALLQV
ncbi:MAG: 2-oxoglutarate dehydrogenase complex dihydrolipoyllysine-residue succinyltransferase [Gammaproteobacteria bacterium]